MKFRHTVIESIACGLPEERWTSLDLEEKLAPLYSQIGLHPGRLELMTGIRARRLWPTGTTPSQAAAQAARSLLGKTRFQPGQIDLLIHAGVCRDRLEPATAAYVHHLLGFGPDVQILDVSNACLGVLNAMVLAGSMIESGQIRTALIVSGENGRPLLENTIRQLNEPGHSRQSIKPFFANLTIGSGSIALLLCHESLVPEGAPRLLAGVTETDTSACRLCQGNASADGLDMLTDSEALLEAGIAVASRAWKKFCGHTGWTAATPARVICHQVGSRHQQRLQEALGLDPTRNFSTFEELGNIGSVSLPLTFEMAREQGAICPGDPVAFLGIGSGLSAMLLAIQC